MNSSVSAGRMARVIRAMALHRQRWNAVSPQLAHDTDPWADPPPARADDLGPTADEFAARWDELQHPPGWVKGMDVTPGPAGRWPVTERGTA